MSCKNCNSVCNKGGCNKLPCPLCAENSKIIESNKVKPYLKDEIKYLLRDIKNIGICLNDSCELMFFDLSNEVMIIKEDIDLKKIHTSEVVVKKTEEDNYGN